MHQWDYLFETSKTNIRINVAMKYAIKIKKRGSLLKAFETPGRRINYSKIKQQDLYKTSFLKFKRSPIAI